MYLIHKLYVRYLVWRGKVINIWSKSPFPANALSNLHPNAFEVEGMSNVINFDAEALWAKITEWSRKAGRAATRSVMLIWYVMLSKDTLKSDKVLILSAISYSVPPIDIISAKLLPIIGWIDEIVSITVAYQKVCRYITPEMQAKANRLLDRWFPEYTPYEMIEG